MNEAQIMEVFRGMTLDSRKRLQSNSFYYLMWGWVVVTCCLAESILLQNNISWHWVVWPIATPIAAVVAIVRGFSRRRHDKHSTAIDRMIGYLWSGWVVLLVIVLLGAPRMGWEVAYIILMAMYGLGTFVSGAMLSFKPLVYGGIGAWAIAVVAIVIPSVGFENILWLSATAIIVSYLIPGYLLRYSKG